MLTTYWSYSSLRNIVKKQATKHNLRSANLKN